MKRDIYTSEVMDMELRQLRCLVAIVDTGSFTDAAIELGISQAAVSRTLSSLERMLGVRLLHRTTSRTSPSPPRAVQVHHPGPADLLAEADDLVREAATGHARLRIGYAWSAMGRHTAAFQRRWAEVHPDIELQLIRTNSATGGLAEGVCDLAVVRTAVDERRFHSAIVGLERRYCAMAADDPWASAPLDRPGRGRHPRRCVHRPAHRHHHPRPLAGRVRGPPSSTSRTSTTGWRHRHRPQHRDHREGTVTQYRRDGIVYRPLRDAPPSRSG